MPNAEACIKKLFHLHFKDEIEKLEALPKSGSYRQYFRITYDNKSILGVYNTDIQENNAYLSFTEAFLESQINVPRIYTVSEDKCSYLVEDIGKHSLYDDAQKNKAEDGSLSEKTKNLYKKTLAALVNIQTRTIDKIDLSYCYPRKAFDKQSMLWDLNYFKYFFLRLMRVGVDEQKFENDIQRLASDLDQIDQKNFLYRDFQSRNVMIRDNTPYFIDFQGGRKGAIYYDVASLLFDANVELTPKDRDELLDYYYTTWTKRNETTEKDFHSNFNKFAIIRLTQALGAFGLRGIVEKKPHFAECIPYALNSLFSIFNDDDNIKCLLPEISLAIEKAIHSSYIKESVANS